MLATTVATPLACGEGPARGCPDEEEGGPAGVPVLRRVLALGHLCPTGRRGTSVLAVCGGTRPRFAPVLLSTRR